MESYNDTLIENFYPNTEGVNQPQFLFTKNETDVGKSKSLLGFDCFLLCYNVDWLQLNSTYNFIEENTTIISELHCLSIRMKELIIDKSSVEPDFSAKVWSKFNFMLEQNREHEALMYLFLDIVHELNNLPNCDSFIISSIKLDLKSVVYVHILNALSTIKGKLQNWEQLKVYVYKRLAEEFDDQQAQEILTAIA